MGLPKGLKQIKGKSSIPNVTILLQTVTIFLL